MPFIRKLFQSIKKLIFLRFQFVSEVENSEDYEIVEKIALSISKIVYSLDTEKRRTEEHCMFADFVNNFVNELYEVGYEICRENNIPDLTF